MLKATSKARLDGFIISRGNAAADSADVYVDNIPVNHNSGGGIIAIAPDESSPTLINLMITDNQAENNGGGLYNFANVGYASPKLTNVSIIRNFANRQGGGFYNDGMDADPILSNVNITGNMASSFGGGFFCMAENATEPKLENVLISGNKAETGAGAYIVTFTGDASPLFTNMTVSGNKASDNNYMGGGVIVSAQSGLAAPHIRNSVFWGNRSGAIDNLIVAGLKGANPRYEYNLIEGMTLPDGHNLAGNIDPKFVNPVDATSAPTVSDYGDYRLLSGSPLINKGLNTFVTLTDDLDGQTRIYGDHVDIGAYEWQDDDSGNEVFPANESIWSHRGDLFVKIGNYATTIRIYSVNGLLIRQINNHGEGLHTITSLPRGIYIVTLSTGETAKIIIP
jgi:hypothetical protein